MKLATTAANIAMAAAAKVVQGKTHEPKLERELNSLLDFIRFEVRARLDEALDDAKEAIDCNMPEIAKATFAASMRIAGTTAADKYLDSQLGIE